MLESMYRGLCSALGIEPGAAPAASYKTPSKEQLIEMLKVSPETLAAFEKAYAIADARSTDETGYVNAKTASAHADATPASDKTLVEHIVSDLLAHTQSWTYTRKRDGLPSTTAITARQADHQLSVTADDIAVLNQLPVDSRPALTATAMCRDIPEDGYVHLLEDIHRWKHHPNPEIRKASYSHFRKGLEILDLDPVMYEMLGCNKNSMGYWLPAIAAAVDAEGFFNIPDTTIVKVPITLLQLSRLDYMSLNRTTLDIVDRWAEAAFKLDDTKHYFIKTGVFSSKFDFRNACVRDPKEVHDIGEYLLFIHNQSVELPYYGVATTNEWVVREFIEDEDNDLTIYHGLPLHTEYRVFVDFDTKTVFGVHNYWDPEVMLNRFEHQADAGEPSMVHDAITFRAQVDKLTRRFEENKALVAEHIQALLDANPDLAGQWSIDIMQNGNKFWLIDMAAAQDSAFYELEVPADKRIGALADSDENWIPRIPDNG